MNGFQKIVLIIAGITLIITLAFIGTSLSSAKDAQQWPPIVSVCPDYWAALDASGNSGVCANVKNLGICPPKQGQSHSIMNFNQPPFTGSNGACAKYNWANNCKVAWDGITYGVTNPCQSSSTTTTTTT